MLEVHCNARAEGVVRLERVLLLSRYEARSKRSYCSYHLLFSGYRTSPDLSGAYCSAAFLDAFPIEAVWASG